VPAVPIRKSVHPDFIICLEDGKKMKMLKRHLITVHGLTPEEYRAKHALPADEPMVTSNYAKLRSELAKASGLGKRPSVRGTAMNPVDHPHGGGEGRTKGGRHPVTPWGKPTKGYRTRKRAKASDKMIIRRRYAK